MTGARNMAQTAGGTSGTQERLMVLVTILAGLLLLAGCSGPDRLPSDSETPSSGDPPTVDGTVARGTSTAIETPVTPGATEPQADETHAPEHATPPASDPPSPPDPTASSPEPVTPQVPADPGEPSHVFDPEVVDIAYQQVGSGFDQPVFVTHAADGSGRIYVLEKVGRVRLLDGSVILDIRNQVIQTGVFGYEHEQGMLGLAFHPRFSENGYFYVHYNDVRGDHVISRFTVLDSGLADPASEHVLMSFHQPEVNFQGGMLIFGSDGHLYIGTGTGGAAIELQYLAQDLDSIYGKILRIDVDGGDPYAIPADNPFVGVDGVRAEIWAYGLRNPWRFSFDRQTNDLFIGGPGQFTEEWIDYHPHNDPAGQNFGWPIYEGTQCWEHWEGPCDPDGLRMPILTYPTYQNGNCVVIGGYVHRGADAPLLNGAYFFGDFCSGNVWAGWRDPTDGWQMTSAFQIPGLISSFGEDEAGTVYVCDIHNGSIYKIIQRAQ